VKERNPKVERAIMAFLKALDPLINDDDFSDEADGDFHELWDTMNNYRRAMDSALRAIEDKP
jgi:hypothetical protein